MPLDSLGSPPQEFVDHGKDAAVRAFLEPIAPFLRDERLTELCINRPGEIYTESRAAWQRHEVAALTLSHCRQLAILVATRVRQRVTEKENILSAPLPDGERCQIILPPSCETGTVSFTIRKPSLLRRTLDDYETGGAFEDCTDFSSELTPDERELQNLLKAKQWRRFIALAVRSHKNIIISGATGSGKTTFTRAIIDEIPARERLVTIEDTPELPLPGHPNHVHLFYAKGGQGISTTTPKMLLESCLRMKPDRILLAELRGDEAYYYLRNVNTGHPGSITTMHANSPREAFEGLGLMIKDSPAGATLSRQDIKSLLYMLIDVVVQFRNVDGQRRVTEIYFDPRRKRPGLAEN